MTQCNIKSHECIQCEFGDEIESYEWDEILPLLIICQCEESDHYLHVLSGCHPICDYFKEKIEEDD